MNKFDFSIIKTLRLKRGITAEELANRAKLTRATVAKIEKGKGNPTIETIDALSGVFQLTSSELIRLAEVARSEVATTRYLKTGPFKGIHFWFPNFEVYHLTAESGVKRETDPQYHEKTEEICLVLSGRLKITVGGSAYHLGPGMALGFKAIHPQRYEIIDTAEFLVIHHNMI
jgi:transcriptional regulator with XRE-family HTH domain